MRKEERLIKSKKRVRDFGEVFTPEWLVRDMCALVPDEMYDLNHTFLEPSCGNGNFLVHILERKLKSAESPRDALLALSCLYGVDILEDNVNECKKRLLTICESFPDWDIEIHSPIAIKILDKQIICGDFLKGSLPSKEAWDANE